MKYTYTEYYGDGPGEEKAKMEMKQNLQNPVEIVIRIEMDEAKYKKRKAKYQENLWVKIEKLFFG